MDKRKFNRVPEDTSQQESFVKNVIDELNKSNSAKDIPVLTEDNAGEILKLAPKFLINDDQVYILQDVSEYPAALYYVSVYNEFIENIYLHTDPEKLEVEIDLEIHQNLRLYKHTITHVHEYNEITNTGTLQLISYDPLQITTNEQLNEALKKSMIGIAKFFEDGVDYPSAFVFHPSFGLYNTSTIDDFNFELTSDSHDTVQEIEH